MCRAGYIQPVSVDGWASRNMGRGRDSVGLQVVIMRPVQYLLGLLAIAALLILVDYSPSDIANQASLLVLILGAGALGLAVPRLAWLAALLLGGTLAATHGIYLAANVSFPYPMSPPGWSGAAALLILIIPAGIAAYLGAGAAVLVRRHHSSWPE